MRTGPFWTRLAAASGIGFAAAAVAAYVLQSAKDLTNAGGVAANATDNVWATWTLLVAIAGVALVWFTSISTARLREVEGGSRRVSAEHFGAGIAIAALLFGEVAIQFALRGAESPDALARLATSIVSGPALAFAAGVYVLAAGVVGIRAGAALPVFSGVIARLSLILGLALVAAGGLWLYRDYAWLNDTAFFAFVGWVFVRSALGTFRWADLDADAFTISLPPATRRPATTRRMRVSEPAPIEDLEDTFEVPRVTRRARPAAKAGSSRPAGRRTKPAARKARKPAARKAATERKATAARKPAAKRAPRKPAPPPPTEPVAAEDETFEIDTSNAGEDEDVFEGFSTERLQDEDEER